METWLLCVMLNYYTPEDYVCMPEPDRARCIAAMDDWLERAYAWTERSNLSLGPLAGCAPWPASTVYAKAH